MISDHSTLKPCERCSNFLGFSLSTQPVAISQERHGMLYHCSACDQYWEQLERYVMPLSREDAALFYPEALRISA